MFIGPKAPFGYGKSDDDHFKLEIDPEAAETVKLIFSMAVKNTPINAIVRYLNENSIPTPIQYVRAKSLQGNYDDGNGTWNTRSVKYILTNLDLCWNDGTRQRETCRKRFSSSTCGCKNL